MMNIKNGGIFMQVAEKYLGGLRSNKKRTHNESDKLISASEFDSKVELTRIITQYTLTIADDITSMTMNEVIGQAKKMRRRSRYGR